MTDAALAAPAGPSSEQLREQLEPVRTVLLENARSQAEQIIGEAHAAADAVVADATETADGEIRRAVDRARAAAQARSDQRLEQARAGAHRHILRTKGDVTHRLTLATHQAVLDLRSDPRYPDLLAHLERLARSQLGPDAEIERDPEGLGGVIGRHGSRRVDYTLPALGDRALNQLGDDTEQLWT
ncbi:MAG: V-type ATP synthase subunit E family protein [Acidimicrobiia bacterium]|nr:V-type ATP synthase subunit E family protein [Acidimicrobiia bacterium]